jgi:hypothetical protein
MARSAFWEGDDGVWRKIFPDCKVRDRNDEAGLAICQYVWRTIRTLTGFQPGGANE